MIGFEPETPQAFVMPVSGMLTTKEVAGRLSRSEKTVNKWLNVGVQVGKRLVKLQSLKIGAIRYVTEADLSAFVAAQNPGQQPVSVPGPTPSQTRRRARSVKDKLTGLGVKTREDP